MSSNSDLIVKIEKVLEFIKSNENSIDFKKIKNEIIKLEAKLKSSLIPDDRIKKIFLDKSLFPNLLEIKKFMTSKFKIDIKERSLAATLSNISYYFNLDLTLQSKIQNEVNNLKANQPIIRKKKIPSTKKKEIITDKSWKDWIKYKPEDLREHLNNLTVPQIKSLSGKLLTSSEKNVRKATLIENIVKKIIRLETHFEMGPG